MIEIEIFENSLNELRNYFIERNFNRIEIKMLCIEMISVMQIETNIEMINKILEDQVEKEKGSPGTPSQEKNEGIGKHE